MYRIKHFVKLIFIKIPLSFSLVSEFGNMGLKYLFVLLKMKNKNIILHKYYCFLKVCNNYFHQPDYSFLTSCNGGKPGMKNVLLDS